MPARPNLTRRTDLFDQVEAHVLRDGFESLRVGALASTLKCSRSTIYKLAPSKEELIALIFERYLRAGTEAAQTASANAASAADALAAYIDVIDEERARGSAQFWREVGENSTTYELLCQAHERGYRHILQVVERGVARGELRPVDPSIIAGLVIGLRPKSGFNGWQPPHEHAEMVRHLAELLAKDAA